MHIRPFRKNLPVTVVTLIALGIMFFLFFMHPHSPEESLEFYTPDGNGVGSFRVDITEVLADPRIRKSRSSRKTWNPSTASWTNSATGP